MRFLGVPEHFNLPIQLAIEKHSEHSFHFAPGGTGAMLESLLQNQVDIAIVLTEGLVQAQNSGMAVDFLGVYVSSPLCWGIHVGANSALTQFPDASITKLAISRKLSGSHLMPLVTLADRKQTASIELDEVGNLQGAISRLAAAPDTYFFWERFTTQPYVDAGMFKRIDEMLTPWPCFVFACRRENTEQLQADLNKFLPQIQNEIDAMQKFDPVALFSEHFKISMTDAAEWYASVHWLKQSKWADLQQQVEHYLPKTT